MPHTPHRLALIVALASGGLATASHAANTVITTARTSAITLGGSDTLTVQPGGSIQTNSGNAVKLPKATAGSGITVDNAGTISSADKRAINTDSDGTVESHFTFINRSGAYITGYDDALRVDSNFPDGSVIVDNAGSITSATGQGLDLDSVRGANVTTTIYNRLGGIIRSEGSDGIKTGANATLYNWGSIHAGDMVNSDAKNDGVDIDDASGVTVYNYGDISGGRHGITTDLGATLYNYGTLTGRNGSGFGSDGVGTVYNYGTITGAFSGTNVDGNGDGDGVDIDGLAYIENHGIIQGTGAAGVDKNGFANGSEGIAAGGGVIINAVGALISGANSGILVDDGSGGAGTDATSIENHGTIRGLDSFGIQLVGNYDDIVINSGVISGSNGLALGMGAGNDTLIVHTGSSFEGQVDGGDGIDTVQLQGYGTFGNSTHFETLKVTGGDWTLTSVDDFSQGGEISSGARLVNQGSILGALHVDAGGLYAGGGSVGALTVNGTVQTNTGLGVAKVKGDLTFASDATLVYGVNADGSSAPISVGGTATLGGAALHVQPSAGEYPWQGHYTVLTASSINGAFGAVTSDYAFLTPTLSYNATSVGLDYARNDVAFDQYASSPSGGAAARSLAGLGTSSRLYNALLNTSTTSANHAIEQLAGSSTANLAAATLNGSAQVGSSMLAAMQSMSSNASLMVGLDGQAMPALAAAAVPQSARNLNDPLAQGRLWLQALGSYGKLDGSHGSNGLEQRTQGAVLGADWALGSQWRLGVLGGYSRTALDTTGVDGTVGSWHAGVYALRQDGPLALRLGAAYSGHDGESKRSISFDGFSERPKGNYSANSQQAFAELGYALGTGRLNAEPFANVGYQRYHREGYREKGGDAALRVAADTQDNITSTFGVRVAHLGQLNDGMSLTPRASLGWRHTYGSVDTRSRQAFLSGGDAFSVQGSALDRDSLLVEVGLDLGVSARQTVGLGYRGELGGNSRNHAVVGQWQLRF